MESNPGKKENKVGDKEINVTKHISPLLPCVKVGYGVGSEIRQVGLQRCVSPGLMPNLASDADPTLQGYHKDNWLQ